LVKRETDRDEAMRRVTPEGISSKDGVDGAIARAAISRSAAG
jgi:hypothetical protein